MEGSIFWLFHNVKVLSYFRLLNLRNALGSFFWYDFILVYVFRLVKLEAICLYVDESCVEASILKKFMVAALFDDSSFLEDKDYV